MMSSICIFLLVTAVILLGSSDSAMVIYRSGFVVTAMSVVNLLISTSKKQVKFFLFASIILWIIYTIICAVPYFREDFTGTMLIYALTLIGGSCAQVAIVLNSNFNNTVLEKAEEQAESAKHSLEKITKVLEESKEGLNIGTSLNNSADIASSGMTNINDVYRYILDETETLNNETETAEEAGNQVLANAEQMQTSVQSLHESISQTSAAMSQISANLSNVSAIAAKRKEGMDDIMTDLDSQAKLTTNLVNQVEQLKISSERIAEFVITVNKISAQTGLLAMNASIEAAHAGTLGKGFSVIAHEIRKLSEETTANANNISDTLKQNAEIVNSTAEAVTNFAKLNKVSSEGIKSTIQGIEEILSGISEMDAGTRDVMHSLTDVVDETRTTSNLVSGVTNEVNQQVTSLTTIAEITSLLKDKVGSLETQINEINTAINTIQNEARENVSVSENISASLDNI
ncbi:MAG: hypothetical protein HUK25_00505, partial [Treponema sp.]|nr:hypothetical protein [Treponema sp.]